MSDQGGSSLDSSLNESMDRNRPIKYRSALESASKTQKINYSEEKSSSDDDNNGFSLVKTSEMKSDAAASTTNGELKNILRDVVHMQTYGFIPSPLITKQKRLDDDDVDSRDSIEDLATNDGKPDAKTLSSTFNPDEFKMILEGKASKVLTSSKNFDEKLDDEMSDDELNQSKDSIGDEPAAAYRSFLANRNELINAEARRASGEKVVAFDDYVKVNDDNDGDEDDFEEDDDNDDDDDEIEIRTNMIKNRLNESIASSDDDKNAASNNSESFRSQLDSVEKRIGDEMRHVRVDLMNVIASLDDEKNQVKSSVELKLDLSHLDDESDDSILRSNENEIKEHLKEIIASIDESTNEQSDRSGDSRFAVSTIDSVAAQLRGSFDEPDGEKRDEIKYDFNRNSEYAVYKSKDDEEPSITIYTTEKISESNTDDDDLIGLKKQNLINILRETLNLSGDHLDPTTTNGSESRDSESIRSDLNDNDNDDDEDGNEGEGNVNSSTQLNGSRLEAVDNKKISDSNDDLNRSNRSLFDETSSMDQPSFKLYTTEKIFDDEIPPNPVIKSADNSLNESSGLQSSYKLYTTEKIDFDELENSNSSSSSNKKMVPLTTKNDDDLPTYKLYTTEKIDFDEDENKTMEKKEESTDDESKEDYLNDSSVGRYKLYATEKIFADDDDDGTKLVDTDLSKKIEMMDFDAPFLLSSNAATTDSIESSMQTALTVVAAATTLEMKLAQSSDDAADALEFKFTKIYKLKLDDFRLMKQFFDEIKVDGLVSVHIIKRLLMRQLVRRADVLSANESDVDKALRTIDNDNDGLIDFNGFVDLLILFFARHTTLKRSLEAILNNYCSSNLKSEYELDREEANEFVDYFDSFYGVDGEMKALDDSYVSKIRRLQSMSREERIATNDLAKLVEPIYKNLLFVKIEEN